MANSRNSQMLSVVLLLLLVGGAAFISLPLKDRVSAKQAERATLSVEFQNLESQLIALKSLSEAVTESEATKKALQAAVPEGFAQDDLILELSALAKEESLALSGISFSPVSSEGRNFLKVALSLSGAYEDLVPFLQKLETADRLLRVNSINVQRAGTSAAVFNINLDAFHQ